MSWHQTLAASAAARPSINAHPPFVQDNGGVLSSVLCRWANCRLQPVGLQLPDLHKIDGTTLADGTLVYGLVKVSSAAAGRALVHHLCQAGIEAGFTTTSRAPTTH